MGHVPPRALREERPGLTFKDVNVEELRERSRAPRRPRVTRRPAYPVAARRSPGRARRAHSRGRTVPVKWSTRYRQTFCPQLRSRSPVHSAAVAPARVLPVPAASARRWCLVNAKDVLGRLGEELAAEYLERADCDPGPQLALPGRRDRHRRRATATSGRLRGEDPVGRGFGTPLEAVTAGQGRPAAPAGGGWLAAHGRRARPTCASTSSACSADRRGEPTRRARAGGGVMAAGPDALGGAGRRGRPPGRGRGRPRLGAARPAPRRPAGRGAGEARDRVRAAIVNSGEHWPQRRVTVGLSPASLPKRGTGSTSPSRSRCSAPRGVPAAAFDGMVLLGELGLDGRVRPVRGVLPAVVAAAGRGLPRGSWCRRQRGRGRAGPRLRVIGSRTLAGLLAWLRGEPGPEQRRAARRAVDADLPSGDGPAPVRRPGALAPTWPTCWARRRPQGRGDLRRRRPPPVPARAARRRQDDARRAAARRCCPASTRPPRWRSPRSTPSPARCPAAAR